MNAFPGMVSRRLGLARPIGGGPHQTPFRVSIGDIGKRREHHPIRAGEQWKLGAPEGGLGARQAARRRGVPLARDPDLRIAARDVPVPVWSEACERCA
jgi:hypothetical protein